jgi:hypothetical protein
MVFANLIINLVITLTIITLSSFRSYCEFVNIVSTTTEMTSTTTETSSTTTEMMTSTTSEKPQGNCQLH